MTDDLPTTPGSVARDAAAAPRPARQPAARAVAFGELMASVIERLEREKAAAERERSA